MKLSDTGAASAIRYQSLFENTPEIILFQNNESIILDVNPAFLHLVGESRENVIDRDFHEFLPERVHPLFKEKLREAFTGKTVRFEMYFAYKNSLPMHWDVVKIPLIKDKKILGVHMIARDITEKVETHSKVFEQNKDLQQFTYMVAHNLRGPLSNAIGLVDALGSIEPYSALFENTFTYAQSSLRQLDQVMEDMNMILSIRNREVITEDKPISLIEVVDQVMQTLQNDIDTCKGTVKIAIPDNFQLRTNQAYLYSILFNLLSNAIKYRADWQKLHVELTATQLPGQGKIIKISNNGLGIDLEKAGDNIFKLYKRFHSQHYGRGLGLYLVKTHVESMGGSIKVSSQPNQGTTFTITIPES